MASERGLPTITLWQPWASLIAHGHKTIETRSWPAPRSLVGRRIAIHAGRAKADVTVTGLDVWRPLLDDDSVRLRAEVRPLPLGAIVATARLAACVPMHEFNHRTLAAPHDAEHMCVDGSTLVLFLDDDLDGGIDVSDQFPFGDFAPGRWAWLLDEITPTTEQCPHCRGRCEFDRGNFGEAHEWESCPTCRGEGACDPIPAKGAQRVWYWQPEEADRA